MLEYYVKYRAEFLNWGLQGQMRDFSTFTYFCV